MNRLTRTYKTAKAAGYISGQLQHIEALEAINNAGGYSVAWVGDTVTVSSDVLSKAQLQKLLDYAEPPKSDI